MVSNLSPTFFRPKNHHPAAKPKTIAAETPIPTPAFAPLLRPPGADVATPDAEVVVRGDEVVLLVVLAVDEVGDSFVEIRELVGVTLLLLDCG